MSSLLTAAVELKPDLAKFKREVVEGTTAASKEAGKKLETDMGQAGGAAGKKLGDGLSDGMSYDKNGKLRDARGRFVRTSEEMGEEAGQKAAGRFSAGWEKLNSIGNKMTIGITLPIVGLGAAAFKSAADFETSMTKITALVGIPREQVKAWGEDVRKLAKTYGASASEAADALFFITSAGLRGQDAMNTLDASLRANAVGLGDVATLADLSTSAMNAYGITNLSATKAMDTLVAAVREGKLEASELAASMGRTLPLASAMGVSFDQVGAVFAAMSRTGTNAAEASSQLNAIFMAIQKPTTEAEKTLEQFGLSASGLREELRTKGLLATLQTLAGTFGDNDEAMSMVFANTEALRGVLNMLGPQAQATEQVFQHMTNTAGSLNTAFEETARTAGFKTKKAWGEAKDALMQAGVKLTPVLLNVIDHLRKLIRWFTHLPGVVQNGIIAILGIAAAAGPLLRIMGLVRGLIQLYATLRGVAIAANAAQAAGGGGAGGAGLLSKLAGGTGIAGALGTAGAFSAAALAGTYIGGSAGNYLYDHSDAYRSFIKTVAESPLGRPLSFVGGLMSKLPGLAEGGTASTGGVAWVGERGPELVRLPAGAQVTPHRESMTLAGAGPSYTTYVNMTVSVEGKGFDERSLAQHLDALARRAAMTNTRTTRPVR